MGGIDGIAASEAVFVTLAGALPGLLGGGNTDLSSVGLVLGRRVRRIPPVERPSRLMDMVNTRGVFFVDATVTLVRRVIRGEPIYQAHRSHAYQWLARRWGSHRRVTVAVMMLNLIWLLPCAFLVTLHPDHAVAIVVVALVPLVALAIAAGSGRRQNANV
jgi:Fuc2NAc and GlcNAc transferase